MIPAGAVPQEGHSTHGSHLTWGSPDHDKRVVLVTCMDARLEAAGIHTIVPPPMYIIRNAGGRVTSDVLRSLVISCTLGIEQILVVHHSQCAMADRTEDDIRRLLPSEAEPTIDFLTIADPIQALQDDLMAIRSCPLLPASIEILGHIYDIAPREPADAASQSGNAWLRLL